MHLFRPIFPILVNECYNFTIIICFETLMIPVFAKGSSPAAWSHIPIIHGVLPCFWEQKDSLSLFHIYFFSPICGISHFSKKLCCCCC